MSILVSHRLAAAALALLLPLASVGCGSDDEPSADSTTTEQAAGDSTDEATDETTDDTTDDTTDEGGSEAGEATCETDSDKLSGSSTVLFSGDVDTGQTEADITAETTAVVSADGSAMEPSTLTVGVDTMFGIKMDEGGSIDSIVIGCAGGQTIQAGVTIGFMITEPGSYPVSLDMSGTEVGTIVVE